MTARCPHSGLAILSCKLSDICDCFEFPEVDDIASQILRTRDGRRAIAARCGQCPHPAHDGEVCQDASVMDACGCTTNAYDCASCGRDTHPDTDASPCESHEVCHRCAPCPDCRDDAAEQAAMDERRGL